MKKSTEQFIQEANLIHNNFYDYSLTEYNGAFTKVKIICPKHGVFLQTPDRHLHSSGCLKCSYQKRSKKNKKSKNKFIQEANLIHNNFYDYSLTEYKNRKSKIKIICNSCKTVFETTPTLHLFKKVGCPKCFNKKSKGEKIIENYLTERNIEFIQQKRFSDCKDKLPLPFDFYIPSNNLLIEFDGIQHFQEIDFFSKDLNYTKSHDLIKTEWAKKNGYDLLRIRYDENIENLLETAIKN